MDGLREEDGRLALLHMPGMIDARSSRGCARSAAREADAAWVDASREYLGSWQNTRSATPS